MQVKGVTERDFDLPPDLEGCHNLITELVALVERQGADIGCMKQRLHNLLRDKYGRSSEKLSPGQLQLFAQELQQLLERQASTGQADSSESKLDKPARTGKNGGGGRKPINASLARIPRDYFPGEDEMVCACCHSRKEEIGKEILEQLDYVPASFRVIQHITHKFACLSCQEGVVEGRKPEQIHNGGKATEGLIAQISTARNADHLPLYRQEQIYAREGVDVSRSSMGRWLDMSAESAMPLYERMREILLESKVIQADESPVLFLDKGRLPKKCKQGYAWAYYGDDEHPYVLYDLQPDRTGQRARDFLRGYSNLCSQTDTAGMTGLNLNIMQIAWCI